MHRSPASRTRALRPGGHLPGQSRNRDYRGRRCLPRPAPEIPVGPDGPSRHPFSDRPAIPGPGAKRTASNFWGLRCGWSHLHRHPDGSLHHTGMAVLPIPTPPAGRGLWPEPGRRGKLPGPPPHFVAAGRRLWLNCGGGDRLAQQSRGRCPRSRSSPAQRPVATGSSPGQPVAVPGGGHRPVLLSGPGLQAGTRPG